MAVLYLARPNVGFDCTIPLVGHVDRFIYTAATVSEPFKQPAKVIVKSEADVAKEMADLIREKPRIWHEILEYFAGQAHPVVYRAFGQLHHKLGRMADERPNYLYTFSDTDFVYGEPKEAISKTARSVGA